MEVFTLMFYDQFFFCRAGYVAGKIGSQVESVFKVGKLPRVSNLGKLTLSPAQS